MEDTYTPIEETDLDLWTITKILLSLVATSEVLIFVFSFF
jgi:hypothetical protein